MRSGKGYAFYSAEGKFLHGAPRDSIHSGVRNGVQFEGPCACARKLGNGGSEGQAQCVSPISRSHEAVDLWFMAAKGPF